MNTITDIRSIITLMSSLEIGTDIIFFVDTYKIDSIITVK